MPGHRAGAVGGLQAVAAVALDDAGIAVALADAGDVHMVACGEGVGLHDVADIHLGGLVEFKLLQVLLGGHAGLAEVAHLGLGEPALAHILEAQLNGLIAVLFGGLLLHHDARSGFNDGNRDDLAVGVEDLAHADLLADDCFLHGDSPLIKVIGRLRYGRWVARRHCSADMTRPSRKTMGMDSKQIRIDPALTA